MKDLGSRARLSEKMPWSTGPDEIVGTDRVLRSVASAHPRATIARCRQKHVQGQPPARDRDVAAAEMGSQPGASDVIETLVPFS
jgi:hypothetical protein